MIRLYAHKDAVTLCAKCHETRRKWRLVEYDPRHPCEWPGLGMIMDSRTTHEARRAGWDHKTAEQIALIEKICTANHGAAERAA